jgi:predicted nucleic acid-binding Zn ribbon protein
MNAEPLTECPQCKGKLKRIIGTGAGPIFKGSGFYQTDYKGKMNQNKSGSDTDSKPKSSEKKTGSDDKK